MIIFSALALVAGIILWVIAAGWNIAPPGTSKINFALLSERENLVIAGGFLITCGTILGAADMLDKRPREITRLLKGGSANEGQSTFARLLGGNCNPLAVPTEEERRLRQLDRDAYR